jgi:biotin carboxyl carrier protein
MNRETDQKYILSANGKQYLFNTRDFRIKSGRNRKISRDKRDDYQVRIGEERFEGQVIHKKQNKYTVRINGNTYHFTIDREESFFRKATLAAMRGEDRTFVLKSPMPGKICEVFVSKGSLVKKGEPLLILEAMKMQNQLLAAGDAKVVSVHVKKNDTVLGDQVLIDMEIIHH